MKPKLLELHHPGDGLGLHPLGVDFNVSITLSIHTVVVIGVCVSILAIAVAVVTSLI